MKRDASCEDLIELISRIYDSPDLSDEDKIRETGDIQKILDSMMKAGYRIDKLNPIFTEIENKNILLKYGGNIEFAKKRIKILEESRKKEFLEALKIELDTFHYLNIYLNKYQIDAKFSLSKNNSKLDVDFVKYMAADLKMEIRDLTLNSFELDLLQTIEEEFNNQSKNHIRYDLNRNHAKKELDANIKEGILNIEDSKDNLNAGIALLGKGILKSNESEAIINQNLKEKKEKNDNDFEL